MRVMIMKHTQYIGAAALLIALAASTSSTYAVSANLGGTSALSVDGTKSTLNTSSSTSTSAGTPSTNTSTGATTNTNGTASINPNAEADSAPVSINYNQTRGAQLLSTTSTAVSNSDMVYTNADLKTYVATMLHNDKRIDNISVSEENVTVTYRERGRFLGIFGNDVIVRATADDNGNVTLHYPWYRFLTSINKDDALKADLEANTKSAISAGDSSTMAWSHLKARLIDALRAGLMSHYEANVSGSAKAK